MLEKLKDLIAKFLHQRGILIENRSANTGGFSNVFDTSLKGHRRVPAKLRQAILREGESRPVPTISTVLQTTARQHGRNSGPDSHRRYLEDGWLEDERKRNKR
jgi:hypothetical protein